MFAKERMARGWWEEKRGEEGVGESGRGGDRGGGAANNLAVAQGRGANRGVVLATRRRLTAALMEVNLLHESDPSLRTGILGIGDWNCLERLSCAVNSAVRG